MFLRPSTGQFHRDSLFQQPANGGVGWGDYDNDGNMDLYVANAISFAPDSVRFEGEGSNVLYHNKGDGTFEDVTAFAGVGDTGNGEGVAWGDYDNDGDFDLYLANAGGPNRLYRNNRDGTFDEVSEEAGVVSPETGVGASWADFDNVGYLDLYVVNVNSPNQLYANNGDGTFTEVGRQTGVDLVGVGRAAAWADFNNDGYLDLLVSNFEKKPRALYRSSGGANNFLVVRPVGTTGNRFAVGARVTVTTIREGAPFTQLRHVSTASSRHAQDSMPVEFGLGDAQTASVTVRFPSGFTKTIETVRANSDITVLEDG